MTFRFTRMCAVLLTIALIVPTLFLASTPRAEAQVATFETNPALVGSTPIIAENSVFQSIKATLSEIHEATTALATWSQWVNTEILMPLAFIMSGHLLKMLTASVLAFVAGAINGTGAPQFVQNLQGHLQRVGDTQAYAFFVQFSKNSNSPFSAAITSSLRTNYLQQTSLAGFFAANRNTLPQYSANQNAFLAGNWSQGGVRAWFALTTQDQNNPYILQQNAQGKLTDMVNSAVAAREQMLAWGQGFLSWCPEGTSNKNGESPIAKVECIDEYGLPVAAQTPGSTIKSYLDRALGSTFGKLENVGQIGKEVGGILSDIGKVMGTIGLAQNILGGSSGGLSGVIQGGPGGSATYLEYRNNPSYLGVTPQTIYQNAAPILASSDQSSMLNQYESAWSSLRQAATSASTTLARLVDSCAAAAATSPEVLADMSGVNTAAYVAASSAEVQAARSALADLVAPVLARADAARVAVADKRAKIAALQTATSSGTITSLATAAPTNSDVSQALSDAQSLGGASASPPGSLAVSGSSLIDRLSLLATNADARQSVCSPDTYRFSADSGD